MLWTPILVCAALTAAPTPDKHLVVEFEGDRATVPLVQAEGHIAVELMIGGRGPYRFNVDTYASYEACIDDDVAEELGLEKIGSTLNSDGSTFKVIDIVRMNDLQVGEVAFQSVSAVVDDYGWVTGNDGEPIHGLLGFALFRDLLWTIDYPGQQLIFERGELDADEDHVIRYSAMRGAPDIQLMIGDTEVRCGIDTGSGAGLHVDLARAEAWGLAEDLEEVGKGRSAYSEFSVYGAELPQTILVAGHSMEGVEAVFVEDWPHPLVGYGLLKDFRVTFDPGHKRVRLLPAAPEVETDGSGGDPPAEAGGED